MQLRYGSYFHAANDATVTIQRTKNLNAAQQSISLRDVWTIRGELHGDTAAALRIQIAALELAYSVDYQDLALIDNDGVVVHALLNVGSTSGVRITQPPSYPEGDGGEFTTYRTYAIQAEAEYAYAPQEGSQLLEFSETVTIIGNGGPRYVWVEKVIGPPTRQIVQAFTTVRATQTGTAVGKFQRPPKPPPIWPELLDNESQQLADTSPQRKGSIYEDFRVSWSYSFTNGSPLQGLPHNWS